MSKSGPPKGWWQASDGLYYPPNEEPGPSEDVAADHEATETPEISAVALRRAGLAGGLILGLGLLAAVVFVVFLRKAPPGPIEVGTVARGDTFALNIAECPGAGGEFASGSIRNDTDSLVSFRIELPFVDATGADLSTESVIVEDLRPLEAAQWTIGPAPDGTLDCAGDRNQVFYEALSPAPGS